MLDKKFDTRNLFYKLSNGEYMSRSSIEAAYEVTHGGKAQYDEAGFLRWLHSLLGKSIVEVRRPVDFTDEELKALVEDYNSVLAVKIYRLRENCSAVEAKLFVDKLRAKRDGWVA